MIAKKIAMVARTPYVESMTPDDLRAWRKCRRLTRAELARELGISASRLLDYELGYTRRHRGARDTPAPVPRVVELALEALAARGPAGDVRDTAAE